MTPETLPADKRLRRRTFAIVAVLLAAGWVLLGYLLPQYLDYLRGLAMRDLSRLEQEYRRGFAIMFFAIGALSAAIAVHVMRVGIGTRRAQCFPPPGMRVIVDTAIVRGHAAVRLGTAMVVGAAIFLVVSVGGSWLMYRTTLASLAPSAVPASSRQPAYFFKMAAHGPIRGL